MSTIARITAPILLILAAYIGGGAELIFPHSSADTSAHSLALQGLLLKLCILPLNIGFLPFTAFLAAGLLAPSYLVLALAYLFTLICGMYALLLTSSQYGIAAAYRARTEGLLCPSSQRRHIAMHCLPFADLISSIWLYIVLHRAQKLASATTSDS